MIIVFVGTGNICRSPLAEGYMRKILSEKGIHKVLVDSAGTNALDNYRPSNEARIVAEENGFNINELKSRQVSAKDIEVADFILVMTENHKDFLENRFGNHSSKIELLGSYLEEPDLREIPDPIGLGVDTYRDVFTRIKTSIDLFFWKRILV
ncbi:MAG: low molecular weight protein arginine phosphatase [Acidobacteria bacterium]|nr:low molecular weight protein arginine phosphatase [Acidobacteriota bacterium]